MVAWYYFYGVVLMGLVVLPNALESSLWRFSEADWIALAYGLAVWPLAAFLLAWSNSMATPVVVMALSPMQIVFTLGIEIALGKRSAFGSGGFGSTMQRTGIAAVVVGLAIFVAGYAMKSGNEKKMQSIDVDRSKRLVDEAETSAEGGNHEGLASRLLSDPVQHR